MNAQKPIGMSPYLVVRGAAEAIDFYKRAFGAVELYRLNDPDGQRIGHAQMQIGASEFMLADEYPDFGAVSPATLGGSPITLHIDTEDADGFVAQALTEGATLQRAVKEEFHGSRRGMVQDPFGYSWSILSKVEEVSPQEMQRRWDEGGE
jgi:PhnB protein